MREKRIFFTLAIAILISAMLLSISGVKEARAPVSGPTIYVDTAASRTTAVYRTDIIIPRKTTVPATIVMYIRVARAPHESTEPPLDTDKTYGWQIRLSWDPAYFKIADPSTEILEQNFLQRHIYRWVLYDPDGIPETGDEFYAWQDTGVTYPTTGLGVTYDEVAGNVKIADGLKGFDVLTRPLPVEYFDSVLGPYAPDKGRHLGTQYDCPYTENLTQIVTQDPDFTPGSGDEFTITDPNYNTLVKITITQYALTPETGYAMAFHLSDTLLFDYDGSTTYPHTTWDAYYQAKPIIPEFPLGLASIMILAPLIPIVYLWRTRQKRKVT